MKKIYISIFFLAIIAGFFLLKQYFLFSFPPYSDLVIENIHLEGKTDTYSIKDGKVYRGKIDIDNWWYYFEKFRVLKLALFFQNLKEEPILFDPNFDIQAFDESINRMKKMSDEWRLQTGYDYAYPVSFLQSFSDTSNQFQIFSKDISENNAKLMISSLEKTQQEYVSNAAGYKKFFDLMIEKGKDKNKMYFLGGDTSSGIQIMDNDLTKIVKNGQIMAKENKKRKECFENGVCQRDIFLVTEPQPTTNSVQNLPIILSEDELNFNGAPKENYGPFLIHSKCWRHREINLIYSAQNCDLADGYCIDWPFLSDGEYWTFPQNFGREKTLKDVGAKRISQSSSAPYGCMDLTYKPNLLSINFILQNYKDARIFENEPPATDVRYKQEIDNLWQNGKKMESEFFDAKFPSDNSLQSLGQYYRFVYAFLIKNNLSDVNLREELLKRTNIIDGKLTNFALVLNRSYFHSNAHFDFDIEKMKSMDDDDYFYTYNILALRMNYSLTFLTFSPFIWISGDDLQYMDSVTETQKTHDDILVDPIIEYKSALEVYSQSNLKKWGELSEKAKLFSY